MKRLKQKFKETRDALKEDVKNIVDPLVLKGATLELRNESENHYAAVAMQTTNASNSFELVSSKWNQKYTEVTNAEDLARISTEIPALATKLNELADVARQIYDKYMQIHERHKTGASATHAKTECAQWLQEQRNLAETSFYPKYYTFINDVQASEKRCDEFVPTPVVVAQQPTISAPVPTDPVAHQNAAIETQEQETAAEVAQAPSASASFLTMFANMAVAPVGVEQSQDNEQDADVAETPRARATIG